MSNALRQIRLAELLRGLNSLLPVSLMRPQGTGGTDNAAYCYSVWLRHAVLAGQAGLNPRPQVIAELGPGDSLGIGLAALLFGAEQYYAFDVVNFTDISSNLSIFAALLALLEERRAIPGPEDFPYLKPQLEDYQFPYHIFSEAYLKQCLRPERIQLIRRSIEQPQSASSLIHYAVPWSSAAALQEQSVDLIFSQAVLEHVDDLAGTYAAMAKWLKDDGYLSHQIDFKSHGTARDWNGHWLYPDYLWRIIRGKRPYLLNRKPYSTHKQLLHQAGCTILQERPVRMLSTLRADELGEAYEAEDMEISGVHFLAVKQRG